MGVKSIIEDGQGKGHKLKVGDEGELFAVIHPHPPLAELTPVLPFRQYFVDRAGSNDMTDDGSVTVVPFSIKASSDFDIYIKFISVEIGDGGSPALNLFGALPALTRGVRWCWFTQSEGEYELHEGILTNKEFVRLGGATGAIGSGTDAYLADVSGGGTEKSYLPNIDMAQTFGMPFGLKLAQGSTDELTFTVQDNLQALSTFNIVGYGIRL